METKLRTFVKSIIWRIIAFSTTFIISLIFTQSVSQSIFIALIANVIKTMIYFAHERIWLKVKWGT